MIILLLHSNIIYISLFFFLNDNAIVLVGRGGGAVQNVQYIIRYMQMTWRGWHYFLECVMCVRVLIIINGIREHYEPKNALRRQYIILYHMYIYLPYIIILLLLCISFDIMHVRFGHKTLRRRWYRLAVLRQSVARCVIVLTTL